MARSTRPLEGAGSAARSDAGLIAKLIHSCHTLRTGSGQCYFETRATFRPVRRRDGSTVLVNDAFSHRESQPSAFGIQARGHERFEYIGKHVGRDARTI